MSTSIVPIQNASAVAVPASRALTTGTPKVVQDSLALSETFLGVFKNQIDFSANITNEIVQSVTAQPSFSVYG